MKTFLSAFFIIIGLFSSLAFAEIKDEYAMDENKITTRQYSYKVKGNLEHGEYRKVRFEIPAGNLLLGMEVEVLSRYPNEGTVFSALSTTGWRLIQIDKFSEYSSTKQPVTTFTVEMWAHKHGEWYAPKDSEIELQVSYAYYNLEGVEEDEFNMAVDQTLNNVHKMPFHISAKEAYAIIELKGSSKGIEEVFLRSDKRCYWGSLPGCTDCVLTKYNNSTGQRTHRYFYNSRYSDKYCN